MARKNKANFELFKQTFLEYQKEWGLLDWDVEFTCESLPTCYADIEYQLEDMKVFVRFADDCPKEQITHTAKHEAIHLLLASLWCNATARFVTMPELTTCIEGTVRRLTRLLPDVKPLEASTPLIPCTCLSEPNLPCAYHKGFNIVAK
jgi:hypothetical protein